MELRIAGTVDDSVVDGDGYRFTIFTQGCPHACPGCQNPETWDFVGGKLVDTDDLLPKILANPLLSGVTFSGGEPFAQAAPLADLANKLRPHGLTRWAYTGYTLEALMARKEPAIDALLSTLDVLVDGRFLLGERDLTLRFRGSKNQRIIDMNRTRAEGRIVLQYDD
ncbi:MAG: anaerobic ribonucleoside-triphosphate reductase activating protein [Schwartzia sp. (in: firmicutes)]